jgi:hypothetical protein
MHLHSALFCHACGLQEGTDEVHCNLSLLNTLLISNSMLNLLLQSSLHLRSAVADSCCAAGTVMLQLTLRITLPKLNQLSSATVTTMLQELSVPYVLLRLRTA